MQRTERLFTRLHLIALAAAWVAISATSVTIAFTFGLTS
jgi:hypothetical protein